MVELIIILNKNAQSSCYLIGYLARPNPQPNNNCRTGFTHLRTSSAQSDIFRDCTFANFLIAF